MRGTPALTTRHSRSSSAKSKVDTARRPGSGLRTPVAAVLALIVAGLIVYANSLHGLRLLDDQRTIVDNRSIRQLSELSAVLHPPRQMPVTGRPLVNLSLALNYAFGELAVEGYHAWNIGVHVLAALALFGLLRLTFARMALDADEHEPTALAFVCAAIWLVHPLNSETVNYLTQRTESMMGLFFLTSFYAAARAVGLGGKQPARPARVRARRRWEWGAVAAAFAAVACKETALTLPLLVALWDRAFAFSSWRAAWESRRHLYGLLATSWLLFGIFARELPFFAPGGFESEIARSTYLLHQGPMIAHYLRLAAWPRGLVFDYGPPGPIALADAWPACALVAALVLTTIVFMWWRPRLGFWGTWFFVTLAPASSLIPIPTEVGAERRMYLPLMALVVLAVVCVFAGLKRLTPAAVRGWPVWAAAACLVGALGATTVARNRDYTDGLRIWQTVLERRPHVRAHEHLAMFLRDAGRIDESMDHLRIAAPDSANALHALASAKLERGDRAGALADYREFVTRHPQNRHIVEARETLGLTLLETGDAAGAVEQFRAVVAKNPEYARGQVGLGNALSRLGDLPGAHAAYSAAIALQPQNVLALASLGFVQAEMGDGDRAVETLRKVLDLQPAQLTARRRLAALLLDRRRFPELEKEAHELVRLAPGDSDSHNLLGVALASQQKFDRAKASFSEALRLDPSNAVAQQNLARLR